jgi:hypothetical protein
MSIEQQDTARTREQIQAEGKARREAMRELLRPYIGEGTLVTHERCGGTIQEHYVTDLEGDFGFSGIPTEATMRTSGNYYPADDIAVANITHVEHVRVDALEWAGSKVEHPLLREPKTEEEIAQDEARDAHLDAMVDRHLADESDVLGEEVPF